MLAPVGKGGCKCSRASSKRANYASFSLPGSSNFIAPLKPSPRLYIARVSVKRSTNYQMQPQPSALKHLTRCGQLRRMPVHPSLAHYAWPKPNRLAPQTGITRLIHQRAPSQRMRKSCNEAQPCGEIWTVAAVNPSIH
jgi:hypothetical protein